MKSNLTFIVVAFFPLASNAGEIDFNRDVRPILSDKCFACHGPDEKHRKAKLRLDLEESAKGKGAIVSGKPGESILVERITAGNEERMPPARTGKNLSPAEIEILRKWIAEGAHYANHWAYEAPRRHRVPDTDGKKNAPRNWIDNFVLARLDRERLDPTREADPRTLVRRLHFDL